MSPRLPKVQEAIELATAETSNITQNQIQSAFELRLECMDSDLRTIHSGVCKLPSPVRNCVYSDPGNKQLAENLRRNVKYIATLLSCPDDQPQQPKSVRTVTARNSTPRAKSAVPVITVQRCPSADSTSLTHLGENSASRVRGSNTSQSTVSVGRRRAATAWPSSVSERGSSTCVRRRKVRPQTVNCSRDLQHLQSRGGLKSAARVKSASPCAAEEKPRIRKCSFSDFGRPLPLSYNKFIADSVAHIYDAPFRRSR